MDKKTFDMLENKMLTHAETGGVHDRSHIDRVLYAALDIARFEENVDMDVLFAACLLHDIGRLAQHRDPKTDHAAAGSDMAYEFLLSIGWDVQKAGHVRSCIAAHRFRGVRHHQSIESCILYDADKLDVCGIIGIARTIAYQGAYGEPLYRTDENGQPITDGRDRDDTFFSEYDYKLRHVYDSFFTARGRELAAQRRAASDACAMSLKNELETIHQNGAMLLQSSLQKL